MTQCLERCASNGRTTALTRGRWYRRNAVEYRPKQSRRDRGQIAGRMAAYVLLFLLPGGGLLLLFHWLYIRLDIGNREWARRLKVKFAGARQPSIVSARLGEE